MYDAGYEPLLSVRDIKKYYPVKTDPKKRLRAVEGVSFEVYEGETLGLVGESGCGKTTVGRQVVGLEKPDDGEIIYRGNRMDSRSFKEHRTELQMVFQDPLSSLNPKRRIGDVLADIMLKNKTCRSDEVSGRLKELFMLTGLPEDTAERYPHEFSGGQRQRIAIARALSLSPKLIVCDEPVSALDMSIQARILNLLKDLQKTHNISYIFIAHSLGSVRYISQRIAVMYLGRIVEVAKARELFERPLHPYTAALIDAVPLADLSRRGGEKTVIRGEVPSSIDLPEGCAYAARCPYASERCLRERPEPEEISEGHSCACFEAKGRRLTRQEVCK